MANRVAKTITSTTPYAYNTDGNINLYTAGLAYFNDGLLLSSTELLYSNEWQAALTAINMTGYRFVNWTVTSGTAYFDAATTNTTNVYIPSGSNATVQANFEASGTASLTIGSTPATSRDVGTITAVSVANKQFTMNGPSAYFPQYSVFQVSGSTGNDGTYVVNSSSQSYGAINSAITAVGTPAKTFSINTGADATASFAAGTWIYVTTGANEGYYTVASSSYVPATTTTIIVVSQSIPSAVVAGNIRNQARTVITTYQSFVNGTADGTIKNYTEGSASYSTGFVYATGVGIVSTKSAYTIKAVSQSGYTFSSWTTTGGAYVASTTAATTNVYLTADGSVTANFATTTPTATLTLVKNPLNSSTSTVAIDGQANPYTTTTGTKINVTATAASGWNFTGWTLASGDTTTTIASASSAKTYIVLGTSSGAGVSATVTANFAINTSATTAAVNLAVSPATAGTATIDTKPIGYHTLEVGKYVVLTATANSGYSFKKWSTSTGNAIISNLVGTPTNVYIGGADTITAEFQADNDRVAVILAASPAYAFGSFGGGTFTRTGEYYITRNGSWINISATPHTGYSFNGWTTSGGVTVNVSTSSTTTFNASSAGTLTANFNAISTADAATITLQQVKGGSPTLAGNIAPTTLTTAVPNVLYTLIANPDTSGYSFSGWTVNGDVAVSSNAASTTCYATKANGYGVITPSFTAATGVDKTLTFAVDDQNSGTASVVINGTTTQIGNTQPLSVSLAAKINTWYTISAAKDDQHRFTVWTLSDYSKAVVKDLNAESTQVLLLDSVTLTANFAYDEFAPYPVYTVTLNASSPVGAGGIVYGGSTGNVSTGTKTVTHGVSYNIEAVSNPGYQFVGWSSTGSIVIANPARKSTTFTAFGDSSITPKFEACETVNLTVALSNKAQGYVNAPFEVKTPSTSRTCPVNKNQNFTMTAVANTGYMFTGWTASDLTKISIYDTNASSTQASASADVTVTANFSITTEKTLTLAVSDATDGTTTAPGVPGTYEVVYGAKTTITAQAFSGSKFLNWSVSDSTKAIVKNPISASTEVILFDNATVTANFTSTTMVSLTLTNSDFNYGACKMTLNGTTYYGTKFVNVNEWTKITATPATGYKFTGWSISDSSKASILDLNSNDTYACLTDSVTITANYASTATYPESATLTIAASPTSGFLAGSVDSSSSFVGSHTLFKNTSYAVVTTAAQGYQFAGWTVSGSIYISDTTSTSPTISLTGDATLTANFAYIGTFNLTMIASPSIPDSTTPALGTRAVTKNQATTITANTWTGYAFSSWTVSDSTKGALFDAYSSSTTVYVTGDVSVTANFAASTSKTLTIAANPSDAAGRLTPASGVNKAYTSTWTSITATAATGYRFAYWALSDPSKGVIKDVTSSSTAVRISDDVTVTAYFIAATTKRVAFLASPSTAGSVTVPGSGSYVMPINEWFTITASETVKGYRFSGWGVSDSSKGKILDPYGISTKACITDDLTAITAYFTEETLTKTFAALTIAADPQAGMSGVTIGSMSGQPGAYQIETNKSYTVSVSPNTGYSFCGWSVSDSTKVYVDDLLGSPTKVLITAAGTITAKFQAVTYANLTMAVSPENTGDVTPAVGTRAIQVKSWYAIKADSYGGYSFSNWTASDNSKVTFKNNISETEIYITDSVTVTAVFTACTMKTLTMAISPSSLAGSTTPVNGANYNYTNEWISISTTAAVGYQFTGWSITSGKGIIADVNSASTQVLITDDATVTAAFATVTTAVVTMAVSPELGCSSITPAVGAKTMNTGWQSITATAKTGYQFKNWASSDSAKVKVTDVYDSTTTMYVTDAATVTAYFELIAAPTSANLTFAADPEAGGVVTINTISALSGQVFLVNTYKWYEVRATAETKGSTGRGYKFAGWSMTANGKIESADTAQTKVMVTGDATLTAKFESISVSSLTVAVSPANSGTVEGYDPTGTFIVQNNTWLTIKAMPIAGYTFTEWTIAGSASFLVATNSKKSPTEITVTGDATLTATFTAVTTATLTLAASPASGGTTSPAVGARIVNTGEWLSISATAIPGYKFSSWAITGDAKFKDAAQVHNTTAQIWLTGNATLTANFTAVTTATLTMAVNPANVGTTNPAVGKSTVNAGEWITLFATPTNGFALSSWSISGSATIIDKYGTYTYIYLTGDATVTANFTQTGTATLVVAASPGYGGAVNVGGNDYVGTHVVTSKTWYDLDPVGKIDDATGVGYAFTGWTVSDNVIIQEYASDYYTTYRAYVKDTSNASITANFTAYETAKLTATISPSTDAGTIATTISSDITSKDHTVLKNIWYTFTATAKTGYKFVSWTGTNASINIADRARTTVLFTGDATLTANFASTGTAVMTTAVSIAGAGMIIPEAGPHLVSIGELNTVYVYPAFGYKFTGWTCTEGAKVYTDESSILYTTANVILTADATVTANFEAGSTAVLTMVCSPSGAGSMYPAEGSYDVNAGGSQKYSIYVYPEEGYEFVNWTGDANVVIDSATSQSTFVTVNGNTTVTAVLQPVPTSTLTLACSPSLAVDRIYSNPWELFVGSDCWKEWEMGAHKVYTGRTYAVKVFESASASRQTKYRFTGWTIEGDASIVPFEQQDYVVFSEYYYHTSLDPEYYYLTLTGNATVTANFAEKTTAVMTMNISPADSGMVATNEGSPTFKKLETATTVFVGDKYLIKAFPLSGYYFNDFIVTSGKADIEYTLFSSGDCDSSSSSSSYVSAYATLYTDATIMATFSTTAPTKSKLTMGQVSTYKGMTLPYAGTYEVHKGVPYLIFARPNIGYVFTKWLASNTAATFADGSLYETEVTVTGDSTITPLFELIDTAVLTMAQTPDGSGTAAPYVFGTQAIVRIGKWYDVAASPNDGYSFISWSGTAGVSVSSSTSAATTVNLTADGTLTATFKAMPSAVLTIVVTPTGGGTTEPAEGVHNTYQGVYTIKAYPATGYYFEKWAVTKGNATISYEMSAPVGEAKLTLVGDATITATFTTTEPAARPNLTLVVSPASYGKITFAKRRGRNLFGCERVSLTRLTRPRRLVSTSHTGRMATRQRPPWGRPIRSRRPWLSQVMSLSQQCSNTAKPAYFYMQSFTSNFDSTKPAKDQFKLKGSLVGAVVPDLAAGCTVNVDGWSFTVTSWDKDWQDVSI